MKVNLPVITGTLVALVWMVVACAAEPNEGRGARAIVNGEPTTEFPTTGILLAGSSPAFLVCTGTLIGCDRFLTAAHCVCSGDGSDCQSSAPEDALRVYLQHAGFFAVLRRHVHPDFAFPDSDIAVLELSRPATGIVPTPLPGGAVELGTAGTIVGFGRSGGGREDYGIKQVGAITTGDCPPDASGPGHLCWSFDGTASNTCNGDSGGPLFVDQGGPVVAGVTSGGTESDCLSGDQSYDTDVFSFAAFVEAAAGDDALGQERCGELPQAGEDGFASESIDGHLEADESVDLEIDVEPGTSELRVTLNATEGSDVDLYVRQGAPASETESTCSAVGPSSYAACSASGPVPGAWHVLAVATRAGDYQLTTVTVGGATVAEDDAYAGERDQELEVSAQDGVLVNDEESPRGALVAELSDGPAHGSVALDPDGSFVYTPEADFAGEDRFTYRAADGTAAGGAVVVLTIAEPEEEGGGCGCRAGGDGAALPVLAFLLLLAAARRRRV